MFHNLQKHFFRTMTTTLTYQKDIGISIKNKGLKRKKISRIKYKPIKRIWYETSIVNLNDWLQTNYYNKTEFNMFITFSNVAVDYNDAQPFFYYEFMEFYFYLDEYFRLNLYEKESFNVFFKNFSIEKILSVYLESIAIPKTLLFNLDDTFIKINSYFLIWQSEVTIFNDDLDIIEMKELVNNFSKPTILDHFCHSTAATLPHFWMLDKNSYLKEVCFFSTGTYFNILGKKRKATETEKKKFFGAFMRNEVADLVIDKYWYKPFIFFLRRAFKSKHKIYHNNNNLIKYIYQILYFSFLYEIIKIPFILKGTFNLYYYLFKNTNINTYLLENNDVNQLASFLNIFFSDNKDGLNIYNFSNQLKVVSSLYSATFIQFYKLFYLYSVKKASLQELPSCFPDLKKNKLIPSVNSKNFKDFFLFNSYEYGYSPVFFNSSVKAEISKKAIIDVQSFYKNNPLASAFQNYVLKGEEVTRFKEFYKNYFLSAKAEHWTKKFEKLFIFLRIKFFTSHFSEHLPRKKRGVHDTIISFYKWKIFVRKKMPYFFDGPWMSVSKNKIGRYWIAYIVNNISDFWFIKNKKYLNDLHISLLGYGFPLKKKITVKMLRHFYASYIYTVSKYKLYNCKIYNPYVVLLNKFYLSPIVPFYLVNTEDNFGRFFEEYYFGHNKQLLFTITSLVRQEFAIPNAFLLRSLRQYSDAIKYQGQRHFHDDEDLVWDLNLSGYNSLYSGRSSTNGLHIFVSYLYEDFFRFLVHLDEDSVPVQEKCKSDSLFFHTFNWDKIEPLD